jgi:hypothetical protein
LWFLSILGIGIDNQANLWFELDMNFVTNVLFWTHCVWQGFSFFTKVLDFVIRIYRNFEEEIISKKLNSSAPKHESCILKRGKTRCTHVFWYFRNGQMNLDKLVEMKITSKNKSKITEFQRIWTSRRHGNETVWRRGLILSTFYLFLLTEFRLFQTSKDLLENLIILIKFLVTWKHFIWLVYNDYKNFNDTFYTSFSE